MTHARSSPPPTLHRRALLSSALGLALGAAGCGYLKAEFARTNALTQELDAYVFQQPFAMVWDKVTAVRGADDPKKLFFASPTWDDVDPTIKRTRPRSEKGKGAGNDVLVTTTFYEVHGQSDPGGCRMKYFYDETEVTLRDGKEVGTRHRNDRALFLELELVRMFDPKSAARIEAAGEEAARSGEWYPKKKT